VTEIIVGGLLGGFLGVILPSWFFRRWFNTSKIAQSDEVRALTSELEQWVVLLEKRVACAQETLLQLRKDRRAFLEDQQVIDVCPTCFSLVPQWFMIPSAGGIFERLDHSNHIVSAMCRHCADGCCWPLDGEDEEDYEERWVAIRAAAEERMK
jgi:hypothetical protein